MLKTNTFVTLMKAHLIETGVSCVLQKMSVIHVGKILYDTFYRKDFVPGNRGSFATQIGTFNIVSIFQTVCHH